MSAAKEKTFIIFDLDNTLTESRTPMDREMVRLFAKLLAHRRVAITSGGGFNLFKRQVINPLSGSEKLFGNLFLFPTNAASFYRYEGSQWVKGYEERLTKEEIGTIRRALKRALAESGFQKPREVFGDQIDERGTQITFSALGGDAPVAKKTAWDPTREKRRAIKVILDRLLPAFEIGIGGHTSIDITRRGINKAYAIEKIEKQLGVSREDMLFVGDALAPGGNDYPVVHTDVLTKAVSKPADTKRVIHTLIV